MSFASELAYPAGNGGRPYADGLTKRELFAAMAMQGFCACPVGSLDERDFGDMGPDSFAYAAVEYADALIAALSKEPKP